MIELPLHQSRSTHPISWCRSSDAFASELRQVVASKHLSNKIGLKTEFGVDVPAIAGVKVELRGAY
jgi:hypothetical protein